MCLESLPATDQPRMVSEPERQLQPLLKGLGCQKEPCIHPAEALASIFCPCVCCSRLIPGEPLTPHLLLLTDTHSQWQMCILPLKSNPDISVRTGVMVPRVVKDLLFSIPPSSVTHWLLQLQPSQHIPRGERKSKGQNPFGEISQTAHSVNSASRPLCKPSCTGRLGKENFHWADGHPT